MQLSDCSGVLPYQNRCGWTYLSDEPNIEIWETGCGEEIRTDEDIEKLWKFCPYCGIKIQIETP